MSEMEQFRARRVVTELLKTDSAQQQLKIMARVPPQYRHYVQTMFNSMRQLKQDTGRATTTGADDDRARGKREQ